MTENYSNWSNAPVSSKITDKFLRFFIKFHGYGIAIISIITAILWTTIFPGTDSKWDDLAYLRYTGVPVSVFEVLWILANSFLLIGIIKEKKQMIYPFCAMFMLVLLLAFIKDVYLLATNEHWTQTIFFNMFSPLLVFLIAYVILSMLALIRLFDNDPRSRTKAGFRGVPKGPRPRAPTV